MPNETITAQIKNKLTPFWNLVSIIKNNHKSATSGFSTYNEAIKAEGLKEEILQLLDKQQEEIERLRKLSEKKPIDKEFLYGKEVYAATSEESEKIQRFAFSLGFGWASSNKFSPMPIMSYKDVYIQFWDDNTITFSNNRGMTSDGSYVWGLTKI